MPGGVPDTSISGRRVACELTALIEQRGKPGMIVSDHGTEFTSNAILAGRRIIRSSDSELDGPEEGARVFSYWVAMPRN